MDVNNYRGGKNLNNKGSNSKNSNNANHKKYHLATWHVCKGSVASKRLVHLTSVYKQEAGSKKQGGRYTQQTAPLSTWHLQPSVYIRRLRHVTSGILVFP